MSKRKIKAADPNPQHIKQSILTRVGWLYVLFFILGLGIIVQIAATQYGPNGTPLSNLSESKCYKIKPIESLRGNILAHDGKILATDAPFYNIRLDWAIRDRKGNFILSDSIFEANLFPLADSLSALFGESRAYYVNKLREIHTRARGSGSGRRNIELAGKVNQIELDRLKQFPLLNEEAGGLKSEKDTLRYKPFGTLAGYTLGTPGSHGLEYYYNEQLCGVDGQNLTVRLVGNTWIPVLDTINREAQNGHDVVTTIDVDLQDVAETALRKQLSDNQAMWGTAVVMEVATGEIRAMANLTHNSDGSITDNYNYSILSRNEPGSTFKLVSLMAMLEQGGMKITDMVDCDSDGRATVYKSYIEDSHAVGKVTVKEMMEQSSNIGFARCIEDIYRENQTRFTDFIDSLGINRRASIQQFEGYMPTIKDPRLGHRNDWNDMTLTKMAYGYALEPSPMHTLMLYNAVASGGKLLAPIIVKELRNGNEVVEQYEPNVINPQICSPSTLAAVRECLEGVVENGTATLLKNENYRVAGKTGTAQMVQATGGYTAKDGGRDYLGTLVGYFPAEAPKYTCIVAIKTHHAPGSRNTYYGGTLAGPVFKAITDRIYALDNEWRERVTPTAGSGEAVEVKLGAEEQVSLAEQRLGISQKPYTPQVVESKQVIDTMALYEKDWKVMPSVMGMGLRDAIYTLERSGLSVEFEGVGEVTEQTPLPDELYLSGDKATIRLAPRPTPTPEENKKKNNKT